jgi:hypothetical protein
MDLRNRRRLQALLVAAVFAMPVLVALALTMAGWVPNGRSYGKAVKPERDLSRMAVRLADGGTFAWRSGGGAWTLVALPGPDCAERCLRELDLIRRARISLGQYADKLRLLYLGDPPGGATAQGFDKVWAVASTQSRALDDLRPGMHDSVSAVLVTPAGNALTRYPANLDPEMLRHDLQKAVH